MDEFFTEDDINDFTEEGVYYVIRSAPTNYPEELGYVDSVVEVRRNYISSTSSRITQKIIVRDNEILYFRILNTDEVPDEFQRVSTDPDDNSVSRSKLTSDYADKGRLFTSDDLNEIKEQGVYYKNESSIPTHTPLELERQNLFLFVDVHEISSNNRVYTQILLSKDDTKLAFTRSFSDDEEPEEFKFDHSIVRDTLAEKDRDLNTVVKNGRYLVLNTTGHTNIPDSFEGLSFILDVQTYSHQEGVVIQTIRQTSGE